MFQKQRCKSKIFTIIVHATNGKNVVTLCKENLWFQKNWETNLVFPADMKIMKRNYFPSVEVFLIFFDIDDDKRTYRVASRFLMVYVVK